MEKEALFKGLKQGDESAYTLIYKEYREAFVTWAVQNFRIDREEALDVFQDVLVKLFTNYLKGRLVDLSVNFKTYLFSIGKHVLLDKMKKVDRQQYVEDFDPEQSDPVEDFKDVEPELNERREKVLRALNDLEEPCYSVLEYYYLRGFTMEMIAKTLEYKSKDVAKTMKMRCFKKLKDAVLKF